MASTHMSASAPASNRSVGLDWLRRAIWSAIAACALSCGLYDDDEALLQGRVTTADGTPLASALVEVDWPDDPEFAPIRLRTDEDGRYAVWLFDGYWLDDWRHVLVTPSLEGWTFEPPVADVRVPDEGLEVDFVATPKILLRMQWVLLVW
jgi:hypothetical protein